MTKIQGILFDFDGTLVDTESQTDQAIADVMCAYQIEKAYLEPFWTRGRTWDAIAGRLRRVYALDKKQTQDLPEELALCWEKLVAGAPSIPGAVEAIDTARFFFKLALVTSSPSRSIEPLMWNLGIHKSIPRDARICAEHVTRSKPDPQGYRLAAKRLGISPEACLVFEDSEAGILAAKAAGALTVAVLEKCDVPETCQELADLSIQNFKHLHSAFWSDLAQSTRRASVEVFASALAGFDATYHETKRVIQDSSIL